MRYSIEDASEVDWEGNQNTHFLSRRLKSLEVVPDIRLSIVVKECRIAGFLVEAFHSALCSPALHLSHSTELS